MILMAYLARRPDTYALRVLLLPITVSLILFAAYHFTWTQVELNVYNWTQCKQLCSIACPIDVYVADQVLWLLLQ
jgi:hypothetical protein